jgi:FtsP/CotA-like multicopper oxidase with cupredoxin domain
VGKIRISRTLFAVVLATCIVLSFAVGLMVNYYLFPSVSNGGHQPQRVGANVYVTIETPMGMQAIPIENVITTIGLQQAATRFMTSGTYTACQYISVGNATASASLTKLTQEYTRAQGTVSSLWTYNGNPAFNVTKKFTFTVTVTLNAAGIHWDGTANSDNNMYACANFQQTTFQQNWNLTITWILAYSSS